MNKKVLFSVLVLMICVALVGCGKKKEDNKKQGKKTGGWDIVLTDKQAEIPQEAKDAFNRALEQYDGMDFELVALLGKQVVAGTNYMFLCKGKPVVPDAKETYKIVVIYNNLENKANVSSVTDFDYTKYVNEDISYKNENVVGGWYVEIPSKGVVLDDKVQTIYDNALEKLVGATYTPIAVVGKQVVSGTNYALLAYGKMATADENSGIYLLTLYEDLNGTDEVVSVAYIDLGNLTK